MTRDRGYPDWLVLSARLLLQPSCGQVKMVQNICFGRVPLWLCEDITACCYMYSYFRNIFPPWSSQMTIILITNAMYHIRQWFSTGGAHPPGGAWTLSRGGGGSKRRTNTRPVLGGLSDFSKPCPASGAASSRTRICPPF